MQLGEVEGSRRDMKRQGGGRNQSIVSRGETTL